MASSFTIAYWVASFLSLSFFPITVAPTISPAKKTIINPDVRNVLINAIESPPNQPLSGDNLFYLF